MCGICNSYSAHLYAELAGDLGVADGLMMKKDFCESLVTACEGQLMFPDYDGVDYCTVHTGGGENDQFWSYPYEEGGSHHNRKKRYQPSWSVLYLMGDRFASSFHIVYSATTFRAMPQAPLHGRVEWG